MFGEPQLCALKSIPHAKYGKNLLKMGHSMSNKQGQLTQYLQISWFLVKVLHDMCVWSLPSHLSQFRMVLEICPIEFSLFWGFHNIDLSLATPTATCFYVCNYLHWIPVGMKIGKSIVFGVENQKMKVETLKRTGFSSNMVISEENNEKCLNWYLVLKLLQKSCML